MTDTNPASALPAALDLTLRTLKEVVAENRELSAGERAVALATLESVREMYPEALTEPECAPTALAAAQQSAPVEAREAVARWLCDYLGADPDQMSTESEEIFDRRGASVDGPLWKLFEEDVDPLIALVAKCPTPKAALQGGEER